jgi:endonuclease YncB( thermonuclease family)
VGYLRMQVEMLESMVINRQDREIGEVVTVDNDLGLHMIRSGWAAEHIAPVPAAEAEGESPRRGGKRRTIYNNPELSTSTQPPTEDS